MPVSTPPIFDRTRPALIADDDDYFRLALSALLRGPLGFTEIVEAASLDEAFDVLATSGGRVGLALFDLRMPGMDSPANLGAVRECHGEVRVAMVSASQDRKDILAALEAGAHGYIPKSLGPAELIKALTTVISGEIFVPALLADLPPPGERPAVVRAEPQPASGPREADAAMSPRQAQVLDLLVRGFSNKQIGAELSLAEGTVKVHVAALLRHLGVANRAAAAAAGARRARAS